MQTNIEYLAEIEAKNSQLPGRKNGPADAYRHILGTAEAVRQGYLSGAVSMVGQVTEQFGISADHAMDLHNNEIGIDIGNKSKSWQDVLRLARKAISKGKINAKERDIPTWLPPNEWTHNPLNDQTSNDAQDRLPTVETNWPPTWPPFGFASPEDPDWWKEFQTSGSPLQCTPYDKNGDGIPDRYESLLEKLLKFPSGIDPDLLEKIRKLVDQAKNTSSPLIIDLDGDGVETLAESTSNIHFDHDNNGFAERSGWVNTDDGLLVRDINGNGQIDSGRELFGNNTLLSNGKLAANGFAALADLDSNRDGVLNASDAAFASLRVWKDADSDGITDEGELLTLAQAGIQSISTSYTDKGTTGNEDAQGNQHRQTGNYTDAQGQTSGITDVWFNTDKARTQDKNTVALSEAILALPELGGMGNVASLRQAMARDASGTLRVLIERFIAETEPNTRASLVTDIIYAWAGVSEIDPLSRGASIQDARKLEALEEFIGEEYTGIWCSGALDRNPHSHAAPTVLKAFDTLRDYVQAQLMMQTHLTFLYDTLAWVWDAATDQIVFDVTATVALLQSHYTANAESTYALIYDFGQTLKAQGSVGQQLLALLQQAGNRTDQGFALALWTIGYKLVQGDNGNNTLSGTDEDDYLQGNAGDDTLNGGSGDDILIGDTGNDSLNGGYGSDTYQFNQGDGHDTISDLGNNTDTDILKLDAGITAANTALARSGYDLKLSWGENDSVTLKNYFSDQSDSTYRIEQIQFADGTVWQLQEVADKLTYQGTTAHDSLSGLDNYANRINGGSGNDSLYGRKLADTLKGDVGDDTLSGYDGNDTLAGGSGNDSLEGGIGSDTYEFNKGDGNDTISDSGSNTDTDILKLGNDLTVTNTVLTRSGYDLKFSWGETDSVTLKNYFAYESDGTYRIEQIQFADGTVWQLQEVADKLTYQGITAHDSLSGLDNYANRINGGIGNDRLSGGKLADTLKGDAGDDTLKGYDGNDTLAGGSGNDSLEGGIGSDTYEFNKGDGNDTISDSGSNTDTDILKLGNDLTVTNTVLTRSGYDLKFSWGETDSVTLKNYFSDQSAGTYRIEQIQFADGTSWQLQEVADKLTYQGTTAHDSLTGLDNYANRINGGIGNDRLSGGKLADTLKGDAGDDTLKGYDGNDTLAGGSGNDSIEGGFGSDTYEFNKGDGNDTISDSGSNTDTDILKLGAGLSATNTALARSGYDLKLSWGETDSVTLKNYFSDQSAGTYRIEQIKFADGTTWQLQEVVDTLTYQGSTAHDRLTGLDNYANRINGGIGNDRLSGGKLADTLKGDVGDDTLSGYDGNDTLAGGSGNDSLEGGIGSDTYEFNKGDGNDTISDSGSNTDTDILKLGAGLSVANTALTRSGYDLKLSWGETDSVTLKNYFAYEPDGTYRIEQIQFADGTVWQLQEVKTRVTLENTADNDNLIGTSGNDSLSGGTGQDTLNGYDGNDTLAGGTGNDSLDGSSGSDIYLFNKGDGHDTISDMDWQKYRGQPGDMDVLKLGAELTVATTVLSRVGDHLKFAWGSADSVTIQNYFSSNYSTGYLIEQIEFADGTIWQTQDIADKLIYNGTEADDTMSGMRDYANRINGSGGNDSISGGSLADSLQGDAGNDSLSGSSGNDTLAGGTGNDSLAGGYGSDTYLFNESDGHDTISEMDWERYNGRIGDTDVLKLGTGLNPATTEVSRTGNHLKLSWGNSDSVTIQDYYLPTHGTACQIQQVEFADGTRWLAQDIANKLIYKGTDADDVMFGSNNSTNRINGGGGNDSIQGGSLADTLQGDAGDDTLNGGYGNDTYLFGRGAGADVISDYDPTSGNADKLSIGAGVNQDQLWFRQVGNDLEVSIIGTNDKTIISNWYSGSSYRLESFNTKNGSALLENQVDALVSAMAAFAPPAPGQTSLPANYQNTLNSVIAANWQ